MPIAKNIKYLRKQHGMSQQELANRLGLRSAGAISKWEEKVSNPPIAKVRQIAEIFDRSFSDLCDIDIEKREHDLIGEKPTPEEMQQILKFRKLPTRDKVIFRAALAKAFETLPDEGGDV